MGEKTGIGWTDHTFNPWWGCTEASPGCDNCYAKKLAARTGLGWGVGAERRAASEKTWREPLKWNQAAVAAGVNRLVFCASMADVMDPAVPQAWRERLWKLVDDTPNLTWLLLTKHPQLYQAQLPPRFLHGNVILGTTAENQRYYDIRWPHLARAAQWRGVKTFISHEPAIGPLLPNKLPMLVGEANGKSHIVDLLPDWIITGGESGARDKVRPYCIEWVYDLVAWSGIVGNPPIFVKQMGDVPVLYMPEDLRGPGDVVQKLDDAQRMWPEGTRFGNTTGKPELNGLQVKLTANKGEDPNEWPECIRVQDFPVQR